MKSTESIDPLKMDARPDSEGTLTALARMLRLRELKPSQVAKLAQCSPSTLSHAVRGEKPLGNRLRASVARALDCDERDLIDPTPSKAVREAIGAPGSIGDKPLPRHLALSGSDTGELERHDHLTVEHLSPGQQIFLERVRQSGGDLTAGVLQPLIDHDCWPRTTVYAATSDLHIRHHATGRLIEVP